MATNQPPNQNPTPGQNQPAGSSQTQKSAKELKDSLKEILKLEGDYRDILKDSIKELQSTLKTYDKMEAKLVSINRSALNIKEIEGQMKKIKEDNATNDKKIADLSNKLGVDKVKKAEDFNKAIEDQQRAESLLIKAKINGNQNLIALAEKNLTRKENEVESLKNGLNLEQLSYAQALKTQELNSEILNKQKEQLKTEEKIRSNIGLTGAVLNGFANKLGIGNRYYEQMVEKARKLNEEGKKLTFADKLKGIASAAGGAIKETIKDPFALAAALSATVPIIGGLIGGLKSALDYILGIQDQTVKFARAMNISTGEARQIKGEFASLSVSSGDIFINTQKMVESQMEMVDALGVTNRLSNDILAANIKLKDIAGLDLETRKGIVEASTITGQNSEELTKTILAQVAGLKQATGVQFQNQKILKEAASQSGYLGLQFAKYPAQLTKSLLTVKAMGLELKQLDSMADSFLDFESSISKEFEAQLLTGKQINLNKARELFLNNDLAGAAAEINGQIGSSADFLKLNRIQADSLASAFGMSRDQMGEMLKQQELLARLGAKQGDSAREQLRLGLERYKNQKALTAAIGEEAYQNLINSSLQEKIAAFIEKVKQSVADFVEKSGIIDKIEQFIEYISEPENIRRVVIMIRDVFAQIVDMVATIASGIISTLDFFNAISDQKAASAQAFLSGAGDRIRSLGGDFGGPIVSNNAAKGAASTGQYMGAGAASGGSNQPIEIHNHFRAEVVDPASSVQGRLNGTGYNEVTKINAK